MTLATESALPCSSRRSAASPATRAVRQGPPAECNYVVEQKLGAVCLWKLPYSSRVLSNPYSRAVCASAGNKHAMVEPFWNLYQQAVAAPLCSRWHPRPPQILDYADLKASHRKLSMKRGVILT